MKRFTIALATLLVTCTIAAHQASAADLPAKAYPSAQPMAAVNWQGLYLDAYGLYAANTTDADVALGGVNIANIGTSPHGPGIGGALGYNFQTGAGGLVLGLRGDIAYANLTGSGSVSETLRISNATNWLGDFVGIVGVPLGDGKLLAYGGGGFAFGGAKPNLQVATVQQGINDTSTGFVVLAGLKYKMTPNWIVGIEGNYFQLGDKTIGIPLTSEGPTLTSANKYHIWSQKLIIGYLF